jgi:hypothetical protein
MHPVHLELLAADRRRELHADAARHRLVREARGSATIRPRRRPVSATAHALTALARRYRKQLRNRGRTGSARVLDDRPIPGVPAPMFLWREREPTRGF